MPRSSRDVYADRRTGKSSGRHPERRRQIFFQPFPAAFTSLMRQDFPTGTSLAVASAALACIVLFSLSSLLIPRPLEEVLPEPMEIAARIMEEPLPEPPPVKKPPLPQELVVQEKPALKPKPMPVSPKRKIVVAAVREKPAVVPPPQKVVVRAQPKPVREVELIVPEQAQRSYDLPQDRPARLPEAPSRSTALNAAPRVEQVASAPAIRKDFRIDRDSAASGALPLGKAFVPAAAGTTVELPSVDGIKQDFGRPHSQGDGGAPITGRSFTPDSPSGEMFVGGTGPVSKSYQASGSAGAIAAAPGTRQKFSTGLGEPGAEPAVDLPLAGKTARRAAAGTLQGQETAAVSGGAVNFVSEAGGGALDTSLLVSLNQLSACIDQSEEDRLRTRLAVLLEGDGQCRSGEMIFLFKNPDTGWTMQVNLYNPIDFSDRCSALLAAIKCINHPK
jgi:outer membrane biosynthesis protein TonB